MENNFICGFRLPEDCWLSLTSDNRRVGLLKARALNRQSKLDVRES